MYESSYIIIREVGNRGGDKESFNYYVYNVEYQPFSIGNLTFDRVVFRHGGSSNRVFTSKDQ